VLLQLCTSRERRRFAARIVAALVGIILVSSAFFGRAAQAQEAGGNATQTESDRRAQAEEHFRRGFLLGQSAGDWAAALKEFLLSRQIFPTKSATRNAAVALRRLGRNVEALKLYSSLLAEFPDQADAVAAEIKATRLHVGDLEILANDDGIRVVIDGVQRGTMPISAPIELDEGNHTLRLSKDGFEPAEIPVSISAGGHQQVTTTLKKLGELGMLTVQEADGRSFDVVVDAAVVGQTPWRGSLAPGRHLVVLRGEKNLGAPPSSAEIKLNETTTLTLRAVTLDSALQIEPTPSNATVYLDDVALGNGIWVGRVPSGAHRVDVIATGHLPFRQELLIQASQNMVLRARLDRDISNPLWRTAAALPLYIELMGGGLLSPSLRGGADERCNCSQRSRPLGAIAELRAGYSFGRFGLELSGGYLSLSENMTRTVVAAGETSPFVATRYKDSTTLQGLLASVGVSYRMLERTPITARMAIGLASLRSSTANSGTFSGEISNPDDPTEKQSFSGPLSQNGEAPQVLVTPFGSTELRIGYRFSKAISADLGAALLILFPPNTPRVGLNNLGDSQSRDATLISPGTNWSAGGHPVIPGSVQLPHEDVAGAFLAVSPSVAVRVLF
jgi:PEGA domain